MNHLYDALLAPHASSPRPFLISARGATTSYAAFLRGAAQLAHALTASGAAPGERIVAQVEKSESALALYAAALQAGIVFVPLNTAYTPAEVAYFVGDAAPALLICDPSKEQELGPVAVRAGARLETLGQGRTGSLIDRAAGMAATFEPHPRAADEPAAILYTSGTTGRSKGAVLSHANLLSNAVLLRDYWRFTGDDRLLHALPIYHVHGLFVATNVVLAAGASMYFLPRFDAGEVIGLMPGATAMMGVPTFYTRLLAHRALSADAARSIRVFISGSAPLLEQTFCEFEARTGHRILERYGMTETGMITSNPYGAERRAGSVGLALPGIDVRIADAASGKALPRGETGVIEVRGPNVFSGYWRRPELHGTEFRPGGYFITGDVGVMDEAGYVSIVGRAKDLVISGGLNIYPKEIEMLIDALEGVIESAVFAIPHPDLGEAAGAAVVAAEGSNVSPEAIKAALAGKLAAFKQPKAVFVLGELPRNAMGKVQKAVLRETYKSYFGQSPSAAPGAENR